MPRTLYKFLLYTSLALALFSLYSWIRGNYYQASPALAAAFVLLAIGLLGFPELKRYSYTVWIFAAVTLSMTYPHYFLQIGDFKLSRLIVPLLQLIMFGMGATMSLQDFAGVIRMPKGVIIGLFCQFTIMPFLGFALANIFDVPPEIAAGIILVGASPSGLASNVMSYLARANVALSITLTAVATTLAPLLTPFYMQVLGGQFVEVDFLKMMLDIVKIVILPVGVGLIFHYLLSGRFKRINDIMPLVSMVSIAIIIVIITATGRDSLIKVGALLMLACLIHNLGGYFLGYWGARLFRMNEADSRTIAIEVGMQNAGLASGLALMMGKVATVGLAPAIFGPMMNISGSLLATWWRNKGN